MAKTKCQTGLPVTHAPNQRVYHHEITGCSLVAPCAGCGRQFDRSKRELVLQEFSWLQGARGNEHHEYAHWCRECSKDAIEWQEWKKEKQAEMDAAQKIISDQRALVQKAVAEGNFDTYWDEEECYFILRLNPPSTII